MNIDIVSRVRAAESGDLPANLLIDKYNTVKCGRLPFTFSHLHKAEAGVCEIFSKSVEPLLDLCITGFNTSLMVVGESDAGREKLLMGDDNVRNGLLPILFAGLFAKIGDDDTYGSGHSGTLLNRVQMQMVEIRGEEIIDLFRSPENMTPLHLTETADSGVKIDNLTTLSIPNVSVGSDALKNGCHRTRGIRESAIIVYIHLTLVPHEKSQPNHSWFTIVLLPGSESLPMDISVNINDVQKPYRFMYRLLQFVHEVSIRRSPDTVIKRPDSNLPALLRDELGGNCKTRVLVLLKPGHDPTLLDALFRFLTDLARIKNYPILNDAFALLLLNRYRAEIMSLECKEEFSTELIQARVECVDLRDAYEAVLPKVDQCRRRIDVLEKEKVDLSDQVLTAEEDKLKLSKMLVEMQIENNKLKEDCEATKFELTNRIKQLESENTECKMKQENCTRTIEALTRRNTELETDLRDVTQEFTVLKTNYTTVLQGYENELAHCDEISAELLKCAQTKAELIRSITVLSQKIDATNPEADLRHARDVVGKRPPTRVKITDADIHKMKDTTNFNTITTIEKRYKGELERQRQTCLDNERVYEAKITNLIKELNEARDLARSKYTIIAELNARVLTLTDMKNSLECQNNRLQHKLKAINEDFRARLIKFVEDASLFVDRQNPKETDECRRKMEPYVNEMLSELRHAYRVREEQLSTVARDSRTYMRAIVQRHESLLVAYRELKMRVTDRGIDIDLGPDINSLDINDMFGGILIDDTKGGSGYLNDMNYPDVSGRLPVCLGPPATNDTVPYLPPKLVIERDPNVKSSYPYAYAGTNMNNSIEATSPRSWAVLQKQLKEFTLNTQQELESERAGLLSRNAMLEQEVTELNGYINTDLKRYKDEIARLQGLLAAPRSKNLLSPSSSPKKL